MNPTPHPSTSPDPVLIVEDHADTAEMLRRLLVRNGLTVEIAPDAASAAMLLARHPHACLVLDEGMPGTSGLEFLRRLRAHPEYQHLPVVFYTAAFDAAKEREAHALGASAWLIKGISRLPDLVNQIRAAKPS